MANIFYPWVTRGSVWSNESNVWWTGWLAGWLIWMTKVLNITCRLFNQTFPFLPCLQAPLLFYITFSDLDHGRESNGQQKARPVLGSFCCALCNKWGLNLMWWWTSSVWICWYCCRIGVRIFFLLKRINCYFIDIYMAASVLLLYLFCGY